MKKLIQGIVDFRQNLTEEKRQLFADLALGQKPDALFIACSDSRVVPNLFASTDPGDLFVLRNIGNLIPPFPSSEEISATAVMEFSLFSLEVADIIVCGHSECGAMQAIMKGVESNCCAHLKKWLKYGESSLEKLRTGITLDTSLAQHNQLSQINVLQQIEHIKSYPFIQKLLKEEKVRIHGWWFDIGRADVYSYDEQQKKFVVIDRDRADNILKNRYKNS